MITSDKLTETISAQKEQLLGFLAQKEQLELDLKTVCEAISQLKGSLAAFKFVLSENVATKATK